MVYGVTTGVGDNIRILVPPDLGSHLSENVIRSHAAGVGEPLQVEEVRAIMFLRANALSKGYSAIRPEIVERLAAMLNQRVQPVVPSRVSVGASGDLAAEAGS